MSGFLFFDLNWRVDFSDISFYKFLVSFVKVDFMNKFYCLIFFSLLLGGCSSLKSEREGAVNNSSNSGKGAMNMYGDQGGRSRLLISRDREPRSGNRAFVQRQYYNSPVRRSGGKESMSIYGDQGGTVRNETNCYYSTYGERYCN